MVLLLSPRSRPSLLLVLLCNYINTTNIKREELQRYPYSPAGQHTQRPINTCTPARKRDSSWSKDATQRPVKAVAQPLTAVKKASFQGLLLRWNRTKISDMVRGGQSPLDDGKNVNRKARPQFDGKNPMVSGSDVPQQTNPMIFRQQKDL